MTGAGLEWTGPPGLFAKNDGRPAAACLGAALAAWSSPCALKRDPPHFESDSENDISCGINGLLMAAKKHIALLH